VDAPARRRLSAPRPDGGAEEQAAGAVFESLADPTRRSVLRAVAEDGPLTATELASRLPVTRQAVAKHLDVLRTAGLVTSAREGRDVRFSFACPRSVTASRGDAAGVGGGPPG
jgi:DNA-binding transcriptional ArsR family regulator